nr:uncharacterized protein LOC109178902 isoform X2 [Ipomoea trifida]
METTHPADRTRLVVRTRIVAPTQAQIERVGEDAHLLEVIMSIAQTMHTPLEILATPLRNIQESILESSRDKKKKKKAETPAKKSRREKFEKLEALSQRLRLCILKRVSHRRHRSS